MNPPPQQRTRRTAAKFSALLLAVLCIGPLSAGASDSSTPSGTDAASAVVGPVTALGRLEPKDGVTRVAGPAGRPAVIAELLIDEGDRVERGTLIAVLDDTALRQANMARARASLTSAEKHFERARKLERRGVQAGAAFEEAQADLAVARADMAGAKAELRLSQVVSPISGTVLRVFTRPGERIGLDGIVELGQTDKMYAIAEVYETDIGRVRQGQRAVITSPAGAGAPRSSGPQDHVLRGGGGGQRRGLHGR